MRQRKDIGFRVKEISEEGEFSGYGSVFGVEDSYSDVVKKGAFEDSLAKWKEKGRLPSMLWQHDTAEPIGVYTKMQEDQEGLYVEGRLLVDADPLAKRAHAHLKEGSLSGLSIGYTLQDWEYDKDKEVYMLEKIDLWEVSLVTFPANDDARVHNVKAMIESGAEVKPSLVERLLRDAGFSRQQALAFMADGYKGINPRDADDALEDVERLISNLRGH